MTLERRPRVMFVSQEDPFGRLGGSAVRNRSLLLVLTELADVTLVVADGKGAREVPADDELAQRLAEIYFATARRVGWRRLLSRFLRLALPRWDLRLIGIHALISGFPVGTYDAAVVSYLFVAHAARALRRRVGLLVFDSHNVEWRTRMQHVLSATDFGTRTAWRLRGQLLRYFEWREVRRYDAIWSVSGQEAAYYRQAFPHLQVTEVPNVVRDPGRRPRSGGQSLRVLFVGRLETQENHEAAMWLVNEIAPGVVRRVPEAEIVIAGRRPRRELLSSQGRNCRVVADPVDVASLYDAAAVAVVPLQQGGGTRIKIVEAFAYGVPVVSTPVGAAGLGVMDGRDLLLAADPDSFADAVCEVLSDTGTAARLARAGREYYERHASPSILRRALVSSLQNLQDRFR